MGVGGVGVGIRCPGWKKIEKLIIGGDDYSGLESRYKLSHECLLQKQL